MHRSSRPAQPLPNPGRGGNGNERRQADARSRSSSSLGGGLQDGDEDGDGGVTYPEANEDEQEQEVEQDEEGEEDRGEDSDLSSMAFAAPHPYKADGRSSGGAFRFFEDEDGVGGVSSGFGCADVYEEDGGGGGAYQDEYGAYEAKDAAYEDEDEDDGYGFSDDIYDDAGSSIHFAAAPDPYPASSSAAALRYSSSSSAAAAAAAAVLRDSSSAALQDPFRRVQYSVTPITHQNSSWLNQNVPRHENNKLWHENAPRHEHETDAPRRVRGRRGKLARTLGEEVLLGAAGLGSSGGSGNGRWLSSGGESMGAHANAKNSPHPDFHSSSYPYSSHPASKCIPMPTSPSPPPPPTFTPLSLSHPHSHSLSPSHSHSISESKSKSKSVTPRTFRVPVSAPTFVFRPKPRLKGGDGHGGDGHGEGGGAGGYNGGAGGGYGARDRAGGEREVCMSGRTVRPVLGAAPGSGAMPSCPTSFSAFAAPGSLAGLKPRVPPGHRDANAATAPKPKSRPRPEAEGDAYSRTPTPTLGLGLQPEGHANASQPKAKPESQPKANPENHARAKGKSTLGPSLIPLGLLTTPTVFDGRLSGSGRGPRPCPSAGMKSKAKVMAKFEAKTMSGFDEAKSMSKDRFDSFKSTSKAKSESGFREELGTRTQPVSVKAKRPVAVTTKNHNQMSKDQSQIMQMQMQMPMQTDTPAAPVHPLGHWNRRNIGSVISGLRTL